MRPALLLRPPALRLHLPSLRLRRDLAAPALVAGGYWAAARLGLTLQFPHTDIAPVWPAAGFGVAALLLGGPRLWPALAVGALLGNLGDGLTLPVSASIAAGSTAEYLLAAVLLRRAGLGRELARLSDVILLALLGGLVAPMAAALLGTASLWAGGVAIHGPFVRVWTAWWLADGIGILVFGSCCLALAGARRAARPTTATRAEAVALMAVTAVVTSLVFLHIAVSPSVLFPLAIWAGVRFEQVGAAGVSLAVSSIASFATVHGSGRFSLGTLTDRILPLQLYTASYTLTALSLAAAITARRVSDQRLRRRTLELEASNQELEAFTYTVSHDLRSPLRAIHGFARVLEEEEGDRLTDGGLRHLATVTRSAEHMSRLIDSLLALATLGRRSLGRRRVDPAAAAREAVENLHLDLDAGGPAVVVEKMPSCLADPVLLEQVYWNLIGNAVKFSRGNAGACVRAGWRRGGPGGPAAYYVRDNGTGFDMRYAPRLFALFERLPQHAAVPGIGAGLAIVARIVDRHGGRAWAEGAPGEGATFYFTIGGIEEGP
ncbi:MAG TPA: MASE1 domain-containing protein [Candidatus Dormibacteraeota bacterium]|jgi:signal transduction histidine kinase|nr:MASE1 domain-containing protein [Candidatus Dormibacteraeota bacterium]